MQIETPLLADELTGAVYLANPPPTGKLARTPSTRCSPSTSQPKSRSQAFG